MLTVSQRKMNIKIRNELRAEGVLPPTKPKLNRKKFAAEVKEDMEKYLNEYDSTYYIRQAINWMFPSIEYTKKITPEQIGVLKIVKMAAEIKKFVKSKKDNGEKTYKIEEIYKDVIKPIMDL